MDQDKSASQSDDTLTTAEAAAGAGKERYIGPYKTLRELGQGGMGTVYLAVRADEQYRKRVAIKVIKGGIDRDEVASRFRRERQILAGLDHPNIAKLLDGGTTEEGLPYLVMDYIEGDVITEYCARQAVSTVERLKLFRSVCSAVQYAHRNLVVHRDIKPGNILVTADGTPRLLDFGIAKLLNPDLPGESATLSGQVMTPEYASPEQVSGGPITTATDVYSLGVVLYELLTGLRPYRLKSRERLEILRAIVDQEPERPSAAIDRLRGGTASPPTPGAAPTAAPSSRNPEGTAERLRRRLRGDLDNIIMMAMRKEPNRRYPSVEALADDIQRHLEGHPVAARKGTVTYRAGKFVKRHAVGVMAVAAFTLLTIGFAGTMAVQSSRLARERNAAERERARAEQVSAFLVKLFKVSDPGEARGKTVTAREILDKGAERVGKELKDQPVVRATMLHTIGSVYHSLGLYDDALRLLEEALRIRKESLGARHADVAASLGKLGVVFESKGEFDRAESTQREALALRRVLHGDAHPDVAASLNNLANVLYRKGDRKGAIALHRESLALSRELFGNEHPDVVASLSNLSALLYADQDLVAAEALFREALPLARKVMGPDHPVVAMILNNLAGLLDETGDSKGAEALYRESLSLQRRLVGDEHPSVAMIINNLATVAHDQRRLAEAESLYRQALESRRKHLPAQHFDLAGSLLGLADLLCETGKAREGEHLAREGLSIRRKNLPGGDWGVAHGEGVLGTCLGVLGRPDEAERLLVESHAVLKSQTGEHSRITRRGLLRLVRLYEGSPEPSRAAAYRALLSDSAPK